MEKIKKKANKPFLWKIVNRETDGITYRWDWRDRTSGWDWVQKTEKKTFIRGIYILPLLLLLLLLLQEPLPLKLTTATTATYSTNGQFKSSNPMVNDPFNFQIRVGVQMGIRFFAHYSINVNMGRTQRVFKYVVLGNLIRISQENESIELLWNSC